MEYVTINGYGVSLDIDDADFKDSKLNKAWTELVTDQFACDVYNVGNVNIYYSNNTDDYDMLLALEPEQVVMEHPKPIKVYTPKKAKQLLKHAFQVVLNHSNLTSDVNSALYKLACKKIDIEAHLSQNEWNDAY